jgi:hypothetical protein
LKTSGKYWYKYEKEKYQSISYFGFSFIASIVKIVFATVNSLRYSSISLCLYLFQIDSTMEIKVKTSGRCCRYEWAVLEEVNLDAFLKAFWPFLRKSHCIQTAYAPFVKTLQIGQTTVVYLLKEFTLLLIIES